eukprot:358486-Chlamydomonas_euryale.AAC.1
MGRVVLHRRETGVTKLVQGPRTSVAGNRCHKTGPRDPHLTRGWAEDARVRRRYRPSRRHLTWGDGRGCRERARAFASAPRR